MVVPKVETVDKEKEATPPPLKTEEDKEKDKEADVVVEVGDLCSSLYTDGL